MEDVRAAFGRRVRELRLARGWSQEQLAEAAELHFTFVSGIERGRRNPGLVTIANLARAFSLSLPELLAPVSERWKAQPRQRTRQ